VTDRRPCVVYGTRPEAVKLSLLVKRFNVDTFFTGQQADIGIDNQLFVPSNSVKMCPGALSARLSDALLSIDEHVSCTSPLIVIAQGDTLTAFAASLSAYHRQIPFAHIEAGLRTHDLSAPFPEEGYRSLIARTASWNFCPTEHALDMIKSESPPGRSLVVGNTIVDVVASTMIENDIRQVMGDEVVITLHRRENLVEMKRLLGQITAVASHHSSLRWTVFMHPNPCVKSVVENSLRGTCINLEGPLPYIDFLRRLAAARLIVTDSGGLQEEAASLGKRVVVCRKSTERPEGVAAGLSRIAFDESIGDEIDYSLGLGEWCGTNPFGDGQATARIARELSLKERV